ncbi:hypothetical protein [Rhizobium hainanense]|uniref:hypothetical protein n=1 Tax=Rhizobium hainanense TaxID=52131 RepID=UPI00117BC88C|nr:hypothetical protein [Rhizobium hainanense]
MSDAGGQGHQQTPQTEIAHFFSSTRRKLIIKDERSGGLDPQSTGVPALPQRLARVLRFAFQLSHSPIGRIFDEA